MVQKNTQRDETMSRLITLTDGVFAIAITLLVLELKLPEVASGLTTSQVLQELMLQLTENLPELASFILSFVILAVFWIAHLNQFILIKKSNHVLTCLSVFFLLFVSLLPFSANVLGHYPGFEVPVLIYSLNCTLCSIMQLAIWWYATKDNRLIEPETSKSVVNFGYVIAVIPVVSYVAAAIICPYRHIISLALIMFVPVFYISGYLYKCLWSLHKKECQQ